MGRLFKESPCKYCCDKVLGCHGDCKDYIEWKAELHKAKRAEAKTKPHVIRPSDFTGTSPKPGNHRLTKKRSV